MMCSVKYSVCISVVECAVLSGVYSVVQCLVLRAVCSVLYNV